MNPVIETIKKRRSVPRGRSLSAGITGTLAAVNYLAGVGHQCGKQYQDRFSGFSDRRLDLKARMMVRS